MKSYGMTEKQLSDNASLTLTWNVLVSVWFLLNRAWKSAGVRVGETET